MHTVRTCVNMCDKNPAALLRAQNKSVYVTSHLIHPQHGSGAVIATRLRNVLSCRRKDDIPTQLPADEGLACESQSSETVNDDIMTNVYVLRMEDGRVEVRLIGKSTRITLDTGAKGNPRDDENTTAILCQCRSVCSRRARAKGSNRLRK